MIDLSNSVVFDVALRCAESVHYHHRDYTTVDDLYQSAFEYLLRHPVMWSQFEEAEDRVMAERTLDRIVMDHLRGIARREKAERSGYHVDDECTYSPKVIAELLPMTFAIESALLPAAASDDAPGRGGNPHGQGDFVASLLDVRNAWITTAFRGDEARLIESHFVDDMSWDHMAASFGITTEQAKHTVAVGLRRMSERLGGLPSRGCSRDCECRDAD